MTPKKLFNGCLLALGIFIAILVLGYAFSSNETTTTEEIPAHQCQGIVQADGSILVSNKYSVYAGPNGIGVTLPKLSQQPYFVLHFKEPVQVFESQELNGADLRGEYRYALTGNYKEEKGKFTYFSGNDFIYYQCLVESVTDKDAIDAQINGGYPFHTIMENFGRDITEYITSIDLCVNLDGKNESCKFYPNDGEVYNKMLSGLLHRDIQ